MLAALLVTAWTAPALADPPDWAPAHGYRNKEDGKHNGRKRRQAYYVGYSGREYDRDFDIGSGRCDREKVGAVLGGVVGGVVGNRVADREDRVVATIIGAAIGALIGASVGRDMDERDRACLGQSLELGATGRPVRWSNPANGVSYELVPLDGVRGEGRTCRNFTLVSTAREHREERRGTACQASPGVWELSRDR